MSLLTALILKNSHIFGGTYFIFLKKNIRDKTWKAFSIKYGPQWKNQESSSQVRHMLVLFYNLVAFMLLNSNFVIELLKLSIKWNLKGSGMT